MSRQEFRELIGRRLQNARLALELPQAEVVKRAQLVCTQASLSNYETGKRDIPLSTFTVLCDVLGLDVADVLGPLPS